MRHWRVLVLHSQTCGVLNIEINLDCPEVECMCLLCDKAQVAEWCMCTVRTFFCPLFLLCTKSALNRMLMSEYRHIKLSIFVASQTCTSFSTVNS